MRACRLRRRVQHGDDDDDDADGEDRGRPADDEAAADRGTRCVRSVLPRARLDLAAREPARAASTPIGHSMLRIVFKLLLFCGLMSGRLRRLWATPIAPHRPCERKRAHTYSRSPLASLPHARAPEVYSLAHREELPSTAASSRVRAAALLGATRARLGGSGRQCCCVCNAVHQVQVDRPACGARLTARRPTPRMWSRHPRPWHACSTSWGPPCLPTGVSRML